jgi:hypothetical protein
MRLREHLTVAGSLTLIELLGLLTLASLKAVSMRYPTAGLDGFGAILAVAFVFGGPVAGMGWARRLVPGQRSNAPGYLVFLAIILYAYYELAPEESRVVILVLLCGLIFAAAFIGTFWSDGT